MTKEQARWIKEVIDLTNPERGFYVKAATLASLHEEGKNLFPEVVKCESK